MSLKIDLNRLRSDMQDNAQYGATDGEDEHGRTVLTGTAADRQARKHLVGRFRDADLEVRIDPVGNIVGRYTPALCDPDAAPVALGSHLDSVPNGGIFDGPLGTYGALEVVRAMQESDVATKLSRPIEVVSFTEEEGSRFGFGTLGSAVATGRIDVSEALSLEDDTGTTLGDALEQIGFRGTAEVAPRTWDSWVELHIEQGTRLTAADAGVGIVDTITGIMNCHVKITGEADHAGSTSMADRSDALVSAAEFILAVEQAPLESGTTSPTAVATAGKVTVEPNVRNIVPGAVRLELDIRDVDRAVMDQILESCRSSLSDLERRCGVGTALRLHRVTEPTQMDDRCLSAADDAVTARGIKSLRLHSAAIHDTANVADVTDTCLLFAPSVDGISHSPREWTEWDDCATATGVLADTVFQLASS